MLLSCKLSIKVAHQRYVYFRKDIDYYCVMHVSGEGIFAHAKGRPTEETHIQLKCSDSIQQKVLQLRKDFAIHDNTKMQAEAGAWTASSSSLHSSSSSSPKKSPNNSLSSSSAVMASTAEAAWTTGAAWAEAGAWTAIAFIRNHIKRKVMRNHIN